MNRRVCEVWLAPLAVALALSLGCGSEEAPAASPVVPASGPTPSQPLPAEPAPPLAEPAAPEAADPPTAPAPLVAHEVPVPENGNPPVVPALRDATRIGEGPWIDDLALAIGAGFVDFGGGQDLEVVHEREHRRTRFVLATTPARDATGDRRALWLAEVQTRPGSEGLEEHRRLAVIRLYDRAMGSEALDASDGPMAAFTCSAETDLRARDLDGDGEIEVTVIAAYLQPTEEQWQGGGTPDECGAVAFIVGARDWNVQAAFSRDYAIQAFAASIEVGEKRETTWQLRDVDADGRSDLHVTERWRFRDDFAGDYVGDGETVAPSRNAGSDRREIDCLYSVEHDAWRCPEPQPGQLLFDDPRARASKRGRRPW